MAWGRCCIRSSTALTKMFASTEFIGIDKILAPTKYLRQQNTRVNKILASTKYSCWQNVGVNKILASTKCWRRRRRIPLLFGSAESTATDFSQTWPRWRSPMSPWWCWSHCMQSPSVALLLAALLLWADSKPYCTGLLYRPAMLKTSQILVPTKYRRPPKIHRFLPNYSCLYISSHCEEIYPPISLLLLWFHCFVIFLYEIVVCSLKFLFWERQVGQPNTLYNLLYVKMKILYNVC